MVYFLIGVTAILAAISKHSQAEDFNGVLLDVFSRRFGGGLLLILSLGLLAYALWCLVQAIMDTERKGHGFVGVAARLFYGAIGIVYLGIAWSALKLLLGWGSVDPGDRPQQEWTARFLGTVPMGGWIVALIGGGFVTFALYEVRRAHGSKFQILKPDRRNRMEDDVGTLVGRVGITARAVVFALIGFFLIRAGVSFDPHQVRGISGVLEVWVSQPYGPWFLIILASGLMAYGIYMGFLSWRRRIDPI